MSTVFSQSVFTLTPGQTANTAMTKTVPAGFTPGTYSADATVGDAAHSTTALANMTVQAPPQPIDVSVTATPSTIPVRTIPAIRATVTNAFGIVAGASVTFRAGRSNGNATTKTRNFQYCRRGGVGLQTEPEGHLRFNRDGNFLRRRRLRAATAEI